MEATHRYHGRQAHSQGDTQMDTRYHVGQLVRETNYGHVGEVAEVRIEAQVVWYTVMFRTITRDVFSDCLAWQLEPFTA